MDSNEYQKFKSLAAGFIEAGQFDDAIVNLKEYLSFYPDDFDALVLLADAFLGRNDKKSSMLYYSRALEVDPVHTKTLLKYASLVLEGENYLGVLKKYHQKFKPQRYIEIGVCKGASFSLVSPDTVAIGVDPDPQLDAVSLPKRHMVIADTSDNYFKADRIDKDLNGMPFDMAFLDGMHLFEYALRDFINLEKSSSSQSVVFVHDLYPMNEQTATRERYSNFWSGDVWKLVQCLKKYRPDLDIEILPCPPTGLGVITKLDSSSQVLSDNYEQILKEFLDMPFGAISANQNQQLLLASTNSSWLL